MKFLSQALRHLKEKGAQSEFSSMQVSGRYSSELSTGRYWETLSSDPSAALATQSWTGVANADVEFWW